MKVGMLPIKSIEAHADLSHIRALISAAAKALLLGKADAHAELEALFVAEAQALAALQASVESEREQ